MTLLFENGDLIYNVHFIRAHVRNKLNNGVASTHFIESRRVIWYALSNIGDFSAVLSAEEFKGGNPLIISLVLIFVIGLIPIAYLLFLSRTLLSLGLMVDCVVIELIECWIGLLG
ncbi:hypothetical protein VNO80_26645 [Phaseolus coccineus]|uniref:Uncharacterized protein n=1 Tax=Phaseolus coccineus TaxID=3886 RepID=A0AAN9QGW7_PHACN